MAGVPVNKFLRIAILWLLVSSPYAYTGALGDSDSTCSGKCSCDLGDSCRFTVDASTTVQVAYQLNQTTENQVSANEEDYDTPSLFLSEFTFELIWLCVD